MIPIFLGVTLRVALGGGGDPPRLAFLFAAFGQYLTGRDDRGQGFAPLEPHLTDADRALALEPDPAAVLRIANFKGLGLDGVEAFEESVRRYRDRIAAHGAVATLAAMQAEES